MSDLIDRQAAIDALAVYIHNVDKVYSAGLMSDAACRHAAESVLGVEELPSAQPEKRTEKRTETHACDCISREAAIDACMKYNGAGYVWACIMGDIRKLPAAQPEIIRCKDCEYYHPSYCEIWSRYGTVQTRENGYCYMAEKRGEEE